LAVVGPAGVRGWAAPFNRPDVEGADVLGVDKDDGRATVFTVPVAFPLGPTVVQALPVEGLGAGYDKASIGLARLHPQERLTLLVVSEYILLGAEAAAAAIVSLCAVFLRRSSS
jgi:hypothetical protein